MKCTSCQKEGHRSNNRKFHPIDKISSDISNKVEVAIELELKDDTYTPDLLRQQYMLHKSYVTGRIRPTNISNRHLTTKKIEPSKNELVSTNKTEDTSKMKCSICKQEGHNKRSCKATTPVSAPKIEAETDVKVEPSVKVEMTVLPSWYMISEINKETYLRLIKPLYDIIEGKKVSKSEPDSFAQQGWMHFHRMTREEWEREHKKIQIDRAWTMAWGDFHQNLMGAFPGWRNYKKGHATGCDIGKEDDTCVAELKNNKNTMNSSSKESVIRKLKKQNDLGKRALIVVINGDINHSIKDGIETISGRKFYEELSGRPTFMDDLLSTTNETFNQFKTFEALKTALGIA
jgi:hypothetical protein